MHKAAAIGIHHLVDILTIIPDICLDIRYATPNNFLGFAVYPSALCFLHQDAAVALKLVQEELRHLGLSLKVFDGYRPLPVQQIMWDAVQDERFVSNPAVTKGRHTRGTAVDVTLIDRKGNELEMPSAFDDFSEKASSSLTGASAPAVKNCTLLHALMSKHGFDPIASEWWHFDLRGWKNDERYPPLSITFGQLTINKYILPTLCCPKFKVGSSEGR